MSLAGPSRVGVLGVVFLALISVLLAAVVWSLDRFHRETRYLTDAVRDLSQRPGVDGSVLTADIASLSQTIENGQQGLAEALSRMRVQVADGGGGRAPGGTEGSAIDDGGRVARPRRAAKRYPVGGMLVNSRSEPSTLNRWTSNEGVIRTILNYVHDGLFGLEAKDLSIRPTLATRWEISDDKLKYTFWLRKGVVFSDGTPFTAEDVVYTVKLIQDPNVRSDYFRDEFKDIKDIVADGDHKVVVHYSKKYWRGIYALGVSLRVFSAKWVRERIRLIAKRQGLAEGEYSTEPGGKRFGELYNKIAEPSVGTGPYYYEPLKRMDAQGNLADNPDKSWIKGQHLTLFRNKRSWWYREYPGKWNIAAQRWRFIVQDVALWEEIRKQAVDARVVDPEKWFDSFSKDRTITDYFRKYQYDHVGIGHSLVYWNCRKPWFQDKLVRQAMIHLIDRETMLRVFDRGVGDFATCVFKKWYKEYSFDLEPRLLDIDKAKKLLSYAGWDDTNGDGIRDRNGRDLSFELMVPLGREEYLRWGQLWQQAMDKAGIKMEVRPLEWATFIKKFYDHEFDAACLYESHTDPWIEPYESYLSTMTAPGKPNHSGWTHPRVDEILERARSEFDDEKRRELFHEFNHLRDEYQPTALLLHGEVIVLIHKRFQNVIIEKRGATPEDWYVAEEDRIWDVAGTRVQKRKHRWKDGGK